jgi:uncharacterized protein (TIRG00374 family)
MADSMRKLLRPRVLVPALLSVALVAALLAFGNIKEVLRLVGQFPRLYLLYFLGLMVAYEAVRYVQWHFLLKALGTRVPHRAQAFAFMVGEAGKSMPIGNYFQSFLLSRSRDEDFGRLSAASTLIIVTEVAVSLLGLVIIGLGTWTTWLRPVIVVGVLVVTAAGLLLSRSHESPRMPKWMKSHTFWQRVVKELREFREGTRDILHPRAIAIMFALGACYLMIAAVAFYLVARGLGLGQVSVWDAFSVYFFGLAFGLIFPLPVDIGVSEISGTGAFLALGVARAPAVSVELFYRALSIGAAIAIALVGMVVLHDELGRAVRQRPGRGRQASGSGQANDQHDGKCPPREGDDERERRSLPESSASH